MKKYIISILIVVLIFGGLNNIREITDLGIVTAVGVDKSESGEYIVTVLVLNTDKKEDDYLIYKAIGKSVQEAGRNIVDMSPKKLYLAHLESLIVSEEIAKNDLEEVLDFYIRDNEGSNNFFLMISKEANIIIEKLCENKIDLKELLKSSVKYKGNSNEETLNDTLRNVLKKGKEICVNSIEIVDEKVKISNMAYFNNWKMQGYLDENNSVIYNLLTNNLNNAIITEGEDNTLVVCEIVNSKSKIDIKDNVLEIKVNITGNISETGNDILINSKDKMNEICALLEKNINNQIKEFVLNYDLNLIGVGNLIYRKKLNLNPNDLNIKITTKVKILNQGGVIKRW